MLSFVFCSLLSFALFPWLSNSSVSKTVTLTPTNTEDDGASISVLSDDVTSTTTAWDFLVTGVVGWHMELSLDSSWGFDSDAASSIAIEIDSTTVMSSNVDNDLHVGFRTNVDTTTADYFYYFLSLETNGQQNYGACDTSDTPTEPFYSGDIETLFNIDTNPQRHTTTLYSDGIITTNTLQNAFPLQITLTNTPNDGLIYELTNPDTTTIQKCGYADAFDTDSGLSVFLAMDAPGDTLAITSIFVNYTRESVCEGLIEHFDWDTMTNTESEQPVYSDLTMLVDETDLSLSIEVTVPYLGSAYGNHEDDANFGVTYVLDFEDFNAHEDNMYEPGTCQNRDSGDFSEDNFGEWFLYSNDGEVGTSDYLAYPPSDVWTIKESTLCEHVTYSATFTWAELIGCNAYNGGASYATVTAGDEWLNLSGTFYINVVSPFWHESDMGYYRVFQILSQPFVIAVSTSVYVLDSTGINLFTMSVVAVYKEDAEKAYRLIVMTESAEYLMLTRNSSDSLAAFTASGESGYIATDFTAYDMAVTFDEECLDNKDYICSQLWEIRIDGITCSLETGSETGVDFSGEYNLDFTPECRDHEDATYCDTWLTEHATIATGIDLWTDLTWVDNNCNPEVFEVQFAAEYAFYSDNAFTDLVSDDTEEYLFAVGEDTIYAEITTDFPSGTMEVFETSLVNVWICTFPPESTVGDADDLEDGGCFSSTKDEVDFTSHIYGDTSSLYDFDATSYTAPDASTVRFSFTVPHSVQRDTLYIHSQIEVALYESSRRRRILLLNAPQSSAESITNRIKHFGGITGVDHGQPINHINYGPEQPNNPVYPVNPINPITTTDPWVLLFIGLVSLLLFVNIAFICYRKCGSTNKRSGRYSSVKIQDSDATDINDVDVNVDSDVNNHLNPN